MTSTRKLQLLLDLQSQNYSAITTANIANQLQKTERLVEILAALAKLAQREQACKGKGICE